MQIVVNGLLTNYNVFGDEKNKPLLILHGWQNSSADWTLIAKELKEYKVILLDLPGFGQTAQPNSDFSIYDYAKFVEDFLDKLEYKKITLLGHSMGARIGIILGAKTKKIEKLILVSPAGIEKRNFFAKIKIMFFKTSKFFLPKKATEKLKQKVGSVDYKSSGPMRNIFLRIVNEDLSYLLPKINVLTLLVWGDKDLEIPLWKIKLMKNKILHVKLRVVWGAGHFPYLDKPKEFIEIINEFYE